ncbi:sporulation protein YhbH [Salibacterium halotolerans]|nr:sporulation protein YhbH [Salibacterium halotolerans]
MSEKANRSFVISKENWSLHRKGHQDQRRHQEKVQEAIRNNLPDLITEEDIVMSNGRDVVRIPIRSMDEYKIRYNTENNKYTGQGDGSSEEGDVIAREPGKKGPGKESRPGDQAGSDYYEAEVTMAELEKLLFHEMELPNLRQKQQDDLIVEDIEFDDIRKKGLMGNIDKRKTILSAIKRNALDGKAKINPISENDLRFKTWNEKIKPESKAVILAMMDTSGSMGRWEKFMARSFFFWMIRFLRTKYETVDIEFIAHHTEAKRVSEEQFFSKGESGGTICSSAYEKALETIEKDYPPERYNIYPFHFSDGDNLTSDNKKCLRLLEELMDVSSMVGYAEVNQFRRHSTLLHSYRNIQDERFRYYILQNKTDVFEALLWFFSNHNAETA